MFLFMCVLNFETMIKFYNLVFMITTILLHDYYFFPDKSKIISQSIIDVLFLRYIISFSKKKYVMKLRSITNYDFTF